MLTHDGLKPLLLTNRFDCASDTYGQTGWFAWRSALWSEFQSLAEKFDEAPLKLLAWYPSRASLSDVQRFCHAGRGNKDYSQDGINKQPAIANG